MSFISANSCYSILTYANVLTKLDFANDTENKTTNEIKSDQESLENAEQELFPIIYQVAGGFVGQLLYFFVFKTQISTFVKLIMFEYNDENEEEQQNQQGSSQPNPSHNNQIQRSSQKKIRMAWINQFFQLDKSKLVLEEKEVAPAMNLPQFVSKVSSTYFKFLMNKKDVQTEIKVKKQQLPQTKKQKQKQKQKQEIEDQSPSHNNNSKNAKSTVKGFSIKSLNRSATTVVTMTTQGNTNTQADMLQSSILNTQQDKNFQDQNDFEDVFKNNDGSDNQDKKDLRGENFMKKNFKALIKQNTDIPNFISPKGITSQRIQIPINGTIKENDQDGVNQELEQNDKINVLSPVGGFDQPINQRRQISMANKFIGPQSSQKNKGLNVLNQTAPFAQTNSQNHIHEEDEQDSYYYDRQNKKHKDQESQIQDNIIHFDEESQNNTKPEQQSQSQIGQSIQQSVSTCLICFDSIPDSIFNPCGHGGSCYECAIDLMKKTGECYLCRQKIEEILKIDIESRNQGIMKIITSTKLVKVREKIEISEQEYQYYSSLRRNRRLQQQQLSGQNQHQPNLNNQEQENQNYLQPSNNSQQNQNNQNILNINNNSQNNGQNPNYVNSPQDN